MVAKNGKIVMILITQSTYTVLEVGIHDDNSILVRRAIDKKDACAQLIPVLEAMMLQIGKSLADITSIVVNSGPAPFTSLRTLIATMNGISFASHIPLYGFSVLEILANVYGFEKIDPVLVVLKAYNNEYYYGLQGSGASFKMGVCHTDQLATMLVADNLMVVGHVHELVGSTIPASVTTIERSYCTLDELIAYALKKMDNMQGVTRLSPLYLKNHF